MSLMDISFFKTSFEVFKQTHENWLKLRKSARIAIFSWGDVILQHPVPSDFEAVEPINVFFILCTSKGSVKLCLFPFFLALYKIAG